MINCIHLGLCANKSPSVCGDCENYSNYLYWEEALKEARWNLSELRAQLAAAKAENEANIKRAEYLLQQANDALSRAIKAEEERDKLLSEREKRERQEPVGRFSFNEENGYWAQLDKQVSEARGLGVELFRRPVPAVPSELIEAAKDVIARWDSPLWKDQPHTGEYIARLRKAVESAVPAVPEVWMVGNKVSLILFQTKEAAEEYRSSFPPSVSGGMYLSKVPVFTAAPQNGKEN